MALDKTLPDAAQALFDLLLSLPFIQEALQKKCPTSPDDLIRVIRHELRQPLSGVVTASSVCLEGIGGPVTEGQKQYLTLIQESGETMASSLSQLCGVLGAYFEQQQSVSLSQHVES